MTTNDLRLRQDDQSNTHHHLDEPKPVQKNSINLHMSFRFPWRDGSIQPSQFITATITSLKLLL